MIAQVPIAQNIYNSQSLDSEIHTLFLTDTLILKDWNSCGRTYILSLSRRTLRAQKSIWKMIRVFVCEMCDKSYTEYDNLEVQMKTVHRFRLIFRSNWVPSTIKSQTFKVKGCEIILLYVPFLLTILLREIFKTKQLSYLHTFEIFLSRLFKSVLVLHKT